MQDYAEAVKWYRVAAEQGMSNAQFLLDVMYSDGRGVAQDKVQAYMWVNLAAVSRSQGDEGEKSAKAREEVAQQMTPDQIAKAQRLASEWRPKTWDELKDRLETNSR